jgi:hypothetical protein
MESNRPALFLIFLGFGRASRSSKALNIWKNRIQLLKVLIMFSGTTENPKSSPGVQITPPKFDSEQWSKVKRELGIGDVRPRRSAETKKISLTKKDYTPGAAKEGMDNMASALSLSEDFIRNTHENFFVSPKDIPEWVSTALEDKQAQTDQFVSILFKIVNGFWYPVEYEDWKRVEWYERGSISSSILYRTKAKWPIEVSIREPYGFSRQEDIDVGIKIVGDYSKDSRFRVATYMES